MLSLLWEPFRSTLLALITLLLQMAIAEPTISVDYVALINDRLPAAAESQRAWPLLVEAFDELEEVPDYSETLSLRDSFWPEYRRWVGDNQPAIQLLHEAAHRPYLGYRYGSAPSEAELRLWAGWEWERRPYDAQVDILLTLPDPTSGPLNRAGKALYLEALAAVETGDDERASRAIESLLRLSKLPQRPGWLVGQLAGHRNAGRGCQLICLTLARDDQLLSDANLRRLDAVLAETAASGCNHLDLQFQRAIFYDLLQRLYTDDGRGNGILTRQSLQLMASLDYATDWEYEPRLRDVPIACASNLFVGDRRAQRQKYDEIMDIAEAWAAQPRWEWRGDPIDRAYTEMTKGSFGVSPRYIPIGLFGPAALGLAVARQERWQQWLDVAQVSIALEQHRRAHGTWPKTLAALTPDLLDVVPPDRFDGKPLKYRLIDGQPALYSVGPDGDDDDGQWLEDDVWLWKALEDGKTPKDGDVLLFQASGSSEP